MCVWQCIHSSGVYNVVAHIVAHVSLCGTTMSKMPPGSFRTFVFSYFKWPSMCFRIGQGDCRKKLIIHGLPLSQCWHGPSTIDRRFLTITNMTTRSLHTPPLRIPSICSGDLRVTSLCHTWVKNRHSPTAFLAKPHFSR